MSEMFGRLTCTSPDCVRNCEWSAVHTRISILCGASVTNLKLGRMRMRSLFSKLLGTQVILLVIIFLTLILASTYLLEHYFHEAKQREVLANADKLVRKIQELEFQTNQGSNVNTLLQTFSEFTGMNAWIVDQGGRILFVAGDSSEVDAPSFRDDWN